MDKSDRFRKSKWRRFLLGLPVAFATFYPLLIGMTAAMGTMWSTASGWSKDLIGNLGQLSNWVGANSTFLHNLGWGINHQIMPQISLGFSQALGAVGLNVSATALTQGVSTVLAAIGLGSNPAGWAIAFFLVAPALVGGLYEAAARIGSRCAVIYDDEKISTLGKIGRIAATLVLGVAAAPFNFVWGFGRTLVNMLKCKGYFGSIVETAHQVNRECREYNIESSQGGGSILGSLIPRPVDHVFGIFVGMVRGITHGFKQDSIMKGLWEGFKGFFVGAYRGLREGSQAAYDTPEYLSTPQDKREASATRAPYQEVGGGSRYAVAKQMGVNWNAFNEHAAYLKKEGERQGGSKAKSVHDLRDKQTKDYGIQLEERANAVENTLPKSRH